MRRDPMRSRPPTNVPGVGQEWMSIDSRRVLPAAQAEQVARFADTVRQLDALLLRLPAVLHLMRDDMAGQPRAAAAHGGDDGHPLARYWCFEHERSLADCDEEGLACLGELSVGPSDPVGNAAVARDQAARDQRALLHRMQELVSVGTRMLGVVAGYPTSPSELEHPTLDDEVGTTWCRSCWKDEKYCEPVSARPDGKPYYVGLCRWCGRTRKAIGGDRLVASDQRGDPPTWLVAKHHRGERVTPGDIARAAERVPAAAKKAAAKKGRKRK